MSEPQTPKDEQAPAAPKVGVDEWVAQYEQRRLERAGPFAPLLGLWDRVPRPAWMALMIFAAVLYGIVATNTGDLRIGINTILFALLALGLNVVVGWAGLLDLGYIAFYGFGAYIYAFLASPKFGIDLATPAAVAVAVASTALLGLLLGLPSWRLLGDYLAIVTLFFAQIFIVLTTNGNRINVPWRDEPIDITGGPNGIPGVDAFEFLGQRAIQVKTYYWISLGAFVVVAVLLYLLNDSRTGRAWRALREDPLAAEAMTIPVNRLKLLAFMFGAATAGLTGSIFAAVQIGVFPQNFELALLITVYAMVILGGAGSIGGVVLGAVTIGITLEVLRGAEWGRVVFYLLLLTGILVLVRQWRYVPWIVGAVIVLGVLTVQIVGDLWPRSVGRPPLAADGPLGGFVDNWVLLPEHPGTIGSIAFVVLVLGVLALTMADGWVRIAGAVPLVYLGVFVWENKLIFQPSVTRFLLVGALLVFVMNLRPQGLMGTARVEIV
jgi:ABC-type branched-subunit amino acid transport system permease subunit